MSVWAVELFWQRAATPRLRYEVSREGRVLGVSDGTSYFDDTITGGLPRTYTVVTVAPDGSRSAASAPITVSRATGR